MAYTPLEPTFTRASCITSQRNRADSLTRGSALYKPPDLSGPSWFDDLAAGDASTFDRWMVMHCLHLVKLEVPIQKIAGLEDVDLRPNIRARRRREKRKPTSSSSPLPDVHSHCEENALSGHPSDADSSDGKPSRRHRAATTRSLLCEEAVILLEATPASQFFFSDGFPWVLTYDIERGPNQDLLDEPHFLDDTNLVGLLAICGIYSLQLRDGSQHPGPTCRWHGKWLTDGFLFVLSATASPFLKC